MTVEELSREMLVELKQQMLCLREPSVSYLELAEVDYIISDEEVFEEFAGVVFVEDDFFSEV